MATEKKHKLGANSPRSRYVIQADTFVHLACYEESGGCNTDRGGRVEGRKNWLSDNAPYSSSLSGGRW